MAVFNLDRVVAVDARDHPAIGLEAAGVSSVNQP